MKESEERNAGSTVGQSAAGCLHARPAPSLNRPGFGRLAIVPLAAILITAAVFWQARQAQLSSFRSQFESDAAARTALIMQETDKSLLAIKSLGWLFDGTGNLDRKGFQAFATACLSERRELQALSWNPRVLAAERAGFEQRAGREGLGQFRITERDPDHRLVPARERGTYYPAFYVEPLRGNEAAAGFDVGSDAVRLAALVRARDTGEPAVTEPIQLVQQGGGQAGFLIFVPVYRQGIPPASVPERRAALEGFAVGVYEAGAVVAAALRRAEPLGLSLALLDCSAPAGCQLMSRWEDPLKGERSWQSILFPAPPKARSTFAFAGRQWSVETTAGRAYMGRCCPLACWLILPAGLLLGCLATRYARTLLSSRERMEQLVTERTAELCQTQEMLRLVLDAIPVRVHWKDRDSVYLGCNRRFAEDAELSGPEEIAGKTDFDLPWKPYAESYRGRDRQVIASGQPMLDYEQPRTASDGRVLTLRQSKLPLRDARGSIIGVLSIYEDITTRKQAEEALRESEARYRAVVESSADGMVVAVENKVVYVNPAAVRLAGAREAGDLVGRSILDFVHEDYLAEAGKRRAKMLETGLPSPVIEGKLRRPNGEVVEAEWMGVPIVYGGKPAILNSFRDMTEHRRRAQALRASEAKYRQLHESMMDAFAATDLDGRLTDCNEAFRRMLGYEREEMLTLSYTDFTPAKWHAFEAAIRQTQVLARGYSDIYEKEYRRKDGTVFPVELRAVLLRDNAGQPYGIWAIVRDITERTRAAEALRRQLAFDDLITRILARFASGTGPEIDGHIGTALEEIGCFIGVEHAAVIQLSPDATTWSVTHEWCAPGIPRLFDKSQKVPVGAFAWTEKLILAGEVVQIHSKDDFPPEAAAIRQHWEADGFKSTLQVPLRGRGGRVQGCIGLYAVRQEVSWRPEDLQRLKTVCDAVANALERQRTEEALRQSETRYRTLFETAQDAIFLDEGERFVDCNPMTLRLFGCDREQVIGQTPMRFSPARQPDGRESTEKAREKIHAAYTGRPQFFEWRHCRLDGSEFEAEVSLNRLEVAEHPMLLAFVRDITARKRAEGLLAGEKRVLEWIARRKPLPAVLNEICRFIEDLSPGVMSSILLLEADGTRLRPVAGPKLPQDWTRAITPLVIGPSVGSCGAAAWHKEQVVVSDIATDPRWTGYPELCALALKCGLRACWSTPILWGGRVVGHLRGVLSATAQPGGKGPGGHQTSHPPGERRHRARSGRRGPAPRPRRTGRAGSGAHGGTGSGQRTAGRAGPVEVAVPGDHEPRIAHPAELDYRVHRHSATGLRRPGQRRAEEAVGTGL